jgi:hypothetical protein
MPLSIVKVAFDDVAWLATAYFLEFVVVTQQGHTIRASHVACEVHQRIRVSLFTSHRQRHQPLGPSLPDEQHDMMAHAANLCLDTISAVKQFSDHESDLRILLGWISYVSWVRSCYRLRQYAYLGRRGLSSTSNIEYFETRPWTLNCSHRKV